MVPTITFLKTFKQHTFKLHRQPCPLPELILDHLITIVWPVTDATCIAAVDYPGMDISPTPLITSSPENCQILCQNFPGCRFFGFDTNNNNCFLKYKKSGEAASTHGFSGPAFCPSTRGKSEPQWLWFHFLWELAWDLHLALHDALDLTKWEAKQGLAIRTSVDQYWSEACGNISKFSTFQCN